jgi:hypothetical protein
MVMDKNRFMQSPAVREKGVRSLAVPAVHLAEKVPGVFSRIIGYPTPAFRA